MSVNHLEPIFAGVPRETQMRLLRYSELVEKWNRSVNLVGSTDNFMDRHIEDSLRLVPLIKNNTKKVIDLGCGAGLPGIVLAIANPGLEVHLVESDRKKSLFCKHAAQELTLPNIEVHNQRIGALPVSMRVDLVVSRALAELSLLCEWSVKFMNETSYCLFHKGKNYAKEIETANYNWSFNSNLHISPHQEGCIIELSEIRKKQEGCDANNRNSESKRGSR